MDNLLNDQINAMSEWVDSWPANRARDPEAAMWSRTAKVAEEAGEVISAMIGVTGQNPRKGVTHSVDDVEEELFDVALTALAAWCHVSGRRDVMDSFSRFVQGRNKRAGIACEYRAESPEVSGDDLLGLAICPLEAVRVSWSTWSELCDLLGDIVSPENPGRTVDGENGEASLELTLPTLDGDVVVHQGDWVVKGVCRYTSDEFARVQGISGLRWQHPVYRQL